MPDAPQILLANIGYVAALGECAVGVLALVPLTRLPASVLALGLHTTILLVLKYIAPGNDAPVPWNVALALAGFALIAPWHESPPRTLQRVPRLLRPVLVLIVIMPAGWYVGVVDSYLAHHLYTSTPPEAAWCKQGERLCTPISGMTPFLVPLPPEHRLFESYFNQVCAPGDRLEIKDKRQWVIMHGYSERVLMCPGAGGATGPAL